MERRDFFKLAALTGGALTGNEWLFGNSLASAASPEISSSNGVLNLSLKASEGLIKYGDTLRWAMTYNGTFPGPTLRAKPGDTLNITLVNNLENPTNLHTHGLHTSPSRNGDNPLLMIEPGESFKYSIKISKNQLSGTYWYHPHHHELSASQVASGLAGALIIEDEIDKLPIFKNSIERVLVLADPRIGKSASISATSQMDLMHGRSGPNTLVNGQLAPNFSALGAKPMRWRIVNSCVSQYQTISFPGVEMWQLATDSSRLPHPFKTDSITLTPGQRTEFLTVAKSPGKFALRNRNQNLATASFSISTKYSGSAAILPFTPIRKFDKSRTIKVVGMGMGMMSGSSHESSFTFDGRNFDPTRIDQSVNLGETEEWTIINPSSMHHPFHLHTWPFQIADDGFGNFLQGWHDTVNLPSGKAVKIRIPFKDIPGTTVYHCHILDHEDAGMMGIIRVR